jgi:hypothetical protein
MLAAIISRPTLGGWTVQITNATNTAGAAAAPQLSCIDALRTTSQDEGLFLLEPGLINRSNRVNSEVGDWVGYSRGGTVAYEHPCEKGNGQSLHVQAGGLLGTVARYFQTPDSGSYSRSPQLSTETWLKTSYNQGLIVSLLSPGGLLTPDGLGMAVAIDAQGQLTYITNDASSGTGNFNTLTGPVVSDGQWHQVVTTWDDSTKEMNLYLDGTLVDTQIGIYEMTALSGSRDTGFYYGNGSNSLLGILDNLLLGNDAQLRGELAYAAGWERVLTPAEVAWHWDSRNN